VSDPADCFPASDRSSGSRPTGAQTSAVAKSPTSTDPPAAGGCVGVPVLRIVAEAATPATAKRVLPTSDEA